MQRNNFQIYVREVLTVSTQPVDNAVSKLSPNYGIQAFHHPLGWNEPGLLKNVSKKYSSKGVEEGHVHGELSLALQKRSIGVDELLRIDILDGNTTHFVGIVCEESGKAERWELVDCEVGEAYRL